MVKQLGKVGAMRREVIGKACPTCGGRTYQLVFQAGISCDRGLSARCTHCQRPRKLGHELGRVLWI